MPTAEEVAPPPPPWTPLRVLIAGALLAGLLVLVVSVVLDPAKLLFAVGFVALLAAWGYWGTRKIEARLDALAESRPDDSICTFARDFDRRSVDPWVVRATWEELQGVIGPKREPFPIRASDRIERDYGAHPDDIDDVWEVIARRTGRSLEGTERNPYYARVETAGDLVRFANSQPLQGAVEPAAVGRPNA